jgi:ketosteroid isomerase-like protein
MKLLPPLVRAEWARCWAHAEKRDIYNCEPIVDIEPHRRSLEVGMLYCRMAIVLRVTICLLVGVLAIPSGATAQPRASQDEEALWNLEHAYWRYAQDNDLPAYLGLWDKDFLGWPVSSAAPVRKDHITDWITSQTSKGLMLKSVEFRPASMQINGNVAVVYYRIKFAWRDKHGKDATYASRITHTWLKTGKDWRIIGGMSMPEPKN